MPAKDSQTRAGSRERNNGFLQTHRQMIDAAIRLISKKGVEALSLAGLARELQVNRTTIYYHFRNREQLITEVKSRAAEQLSIGLDFELTEQARSEYITRFVLENPELIKLWLEDLWAGRDIREMYPVWDKLVQGMHETFDGSGDRQGNPIDIEVYCLNMLISAFIAPGIFRNCVAPDESTERIVARFRAEHERNFP